MARAVNPSHHPPHPTILSKPTLSLDKQVSYAEDILGAMSLTKDFAPLVVLCGHGSQSANNPQKTSLDCGACGGHHGLPHAQIMRDLLNDGTVRAQLAKRGLTIPEQTHFVAAEHNTTTDAVFVDKLHMPAKFSKAIHNLEKDLHTAQMHTAAERRHLTGKNKSDLSSITCAEVKSTHWAEVHGDKGLARNASLIVGARWLTQPF